MNQAALSEGVSFDPYSIPTPYIVVDLGLLRKNLDLLSRVQSESGASVLLAQKGFATWSLYPLCAQYLSGVTSSSVHEARLGKEEFKKEVHVYAPAYSQEDVNELCGNVAQNAGGFAENSQRLADHIVFNSIGQMRRYRAQVEAAGIEWGLRLNPEHREVETELYDPCAPGSRLGVTLRALKETPLTEDELSALSGVHFHNLCQKNSDALERTLRVVEEKFADLISHAKWVNFGGGHHITRPDYDVPRLISVVKDFKLRSGKQIYLEPGEAIALNTGYLVAEVLDIVYGAEGSLPTAILDTSATAHMPDVLEMPYRPEILGGHEPHAEAHTYRLGGLTCLAGDVIGDWSFKEPLSIGSRLIFTDMAHYTMVKSTTFNGVRLPSVATYEPEPGKYPAPSGMDDGEELQPGKLREVRRFGYEDYKSRLS